MANGRILIQWRKSKTDDVSYNIYRGTVSSGPYLKLNVDLIIETKFEDSTVITGTTYYYVVKSVDLGGNESNFSAEITASALAVIEAPTDLTVTVLRR